MIVSFKNRGTEHVYQGGDSKAARRVCPQVLWSIARRKLEYMNAARTLGDLARQPGNRLETLKGNRAGQHSIRINDQYRICFIWTDQDAAEVEIADYH